MKIVLRLYYNLSRQIMETAAEDMALPRAAAG